MSINLHCDEEAIVKTTKLIGPALDWAVAKCEGRAWPDNAAKFLGGAVLQTLNRLVSGWSNY